MENSNRDGFDNGVATTRNGKPVRGTLIGGDIASAPVRPVPPPPPPRDPDEAFDVTSLRHSLRRRWPLALILGLLLAPLGVAAGWFALQPKYAASAFLRIDSADTPLVFQTADRKNSRSAFDLYKNTQSQLIFTPFVLNKALADPRIKDLPIVKSQTDPFVWLKDTLQVNFPSKSEVMVVSLESDAKSSSVAIVEAVVDAYMNEAVLAERNERLKRLDTLERAKAEAEGQVRSRRAAMRSLADQLGTSDTESLSVAQQMAIERYGQVQSQLGTINFELMRQRGDVEAAEQMLASVAEQIGIELSTDTPADGEDVATVEPIATPEGDPDDAEIVLAVDEVESRLDADGTYQRMFLESRRLKQEIATMELQYGDGFIAPKRRELEATERDMQERRDRLERIMLAQKRRDVAAGVNPAVDPRMSFADQEKAREQIKQRDEFFRQQQALVAKKTQVGVLLEQKRLVESELAKLSAETKKLGRSSIDIEMMRAEISSLDEVLARLSGEIERTKIELRGGSRVTLISNATGSDDYSPKKRLAAAGVLGMGGLFFPLFAFCAFDMSRKLIGDVETIDRETGISVLGSVPYARQESKRRDPEGDYGNSVSSIVAMLIHNSKFSQSKMLMVTSAIQGEGKSTLSESLWRGLADSGYRVLLADFDLRRPSIHNLLRCDVENGIADVLIGRVDVDAAIREDGPNRFFMTAGSREPVNLAASAQDVLPNLLEHFRDEFDFIILDTPPVLPVVDSRIIGEHVDGAVLSVMRDRSRVPQLVATRESLLAHGTPIIGVVVAGCKSSAGSYAYYYN